MSGTGTVAQNRVLRYLARFIRLLLVIAIYALLLWYGTATAAQFDTPPLPTKIAIALIALGITGSVYRILIDVANESKGVIMVLAKFLNDKLLEPAQEKLRAEGRDQGRAEGRDQGRAEGRVEVIAKVRSRLVEMGINPDDILPSEELPAEESGGDDLT